MTSPKAPRNQSASQVAQEPEKFAVWAAHHGCSLALYSDLPEAMQVELRAVFDVSGRIPKSWVLKTSEEYKRLKADSPNFLGFLKKAHKSDPNLFADNLPEQNDLREKLTSVYNAWRRLMTISKSTERWNEADYAGQVYNMVRSPAVSKNRLRLQSAIALPRPRITPLPGSPTKRILATKSVNPDGALFVASTSIEQLSAAGNSPLNRLVERSPGVPRGKFSAQATLADRLPDKPKFEFASSVWEDKKPDQTQIDNAWRQNRMAAAAAARHHHAFDVKTPVIGLVWGEGTVRAHVDWACEENGHITVYSAPYPGQEKPEERRESGASGTSAAFSGVSGLPAVPDFHTWALDEPAAILAVHFLVRNIDEWTSKAFAKHVNEGVMRVARGKVPFVPWRPSGPRREKPAAVVTKSPVEENACASVAVKKGPDSAEPAKSATRTRSGLRPRK